jgi:glutamate-ammonia-ligase adenylyltransferase
MRPFAARLTRCPIAHDTGPAADAAMAFADLPPDLRGLLAATAGCSPYLGGLMAREAAWLRVALALSPETALQAVLSPLSEVPPDALAGALRQAKRRVALLVGLADLGGVWALEQVTGALTALADRAVDLALRAEVAAEVRRGRLTPPEGAVAGGMVVLAMGKGGAGELNYSSDIDLICMFDDALFPGAVAEARTAFVRITRRMAAMLSDMTGEGYVFRTDLRLRPDAAVTPVCLPMSAAEHYYEAEGRTWERAAYIKARPCAGDIAAGERFLRALVPFVWRKHLDYAAIQDAHDMRLRIRDHRQLHGIAVEGHNLKLGAGGIREIEFFAQTRQLIAGGRDRRLRDRTTAGALTALARAGWIPAPVAADLTDHYRAHREVEHRLQMVQDARTHTMPATPEGVDRIARMCGEGDTAAFRRALLDRLHAVDRLTEGFFAPAAAAEGPALSEAARAVVQGWASYPALKSDRAQAVFRRLRPQLLHALYARAANPDEALAALDGFLRGLPAGVQVFSLFEANPTLVDLVVDVAATSPALAAYLSRNAAVFDAVIGGSFWAEWPGVADLAVDLGAAMAGVVDYEGKLNALRTRMKEWHFRVGVHHLRGLTDAFEAGKQYADLAEAVIVALWPVVVAEVARRHGPAPGRGACVLGMGSLGAGRLNARSDLDLIVVYDAAGVEMSAGPRPLAARAWFARLTQAFVTALTAPMAEGRLYEVDMRLRPSGRQGPVAVSLAGFESYQMTEAWTWEHLALTRARPIAGDAGLRGEVEAIRRAVLAAKAGGATVPADVAAMRGRLFAAKPAEGAWEAKNGPGRLMDIELLAQTCALTAGDAARRVEAQLAAGRRSGRLTASDEAALRHAYRLLWHLQAGTRALTDRALRIEALGAGGRAFLLRETGQADAAALSARLDAAVGQAAGIIDRLLPVGEGGDGPG